MVDEVLIVLTE